MAIVEVERVTSCLQYVSAPIGFGKNRRTGILCQVQRTRFSQFIGPGNGLVVRCASTDLSRIAELYGWTGKPDEGTQELATEVARKVKAIDTKLGLHVYPRPGGYLDLLGG